MSEVTATPLPRKDVHRVPLIDGQPASRRVWSRWRRRATSLLVSQGEREEANLDLLLQSQPAVSRPNTVAVISPKGGVGKTTSTFVLGNLLLSHVKLRAVAVDANPDFGTLAALAPDGLRCERSLVDLLEDMEQVATAAALRRYISPLPSGLHLLAAPKDPRAMAGIAPERYGELLTYLAVFYDVVLLDLGTGVTGPLAQFAISRADQLVLVTTPEWITSSVVLDALAHVEHEHTTVLANKFHSRKRSDLVALEERLRQRRLQRTVALPFDEQLAGMLDTGTYSLEALERSSRMAVKKLGLSVAEQLE